MKISQFDIWTADLNANQGTEAGKARPVVIIQSDLLNNLHPSTIICPLTTSVVEESEILRVHLRKGQTEKRSDILVDQILVIDNRRLLKKIGRIHEKQREKLKENIRIVLDL